MFANLTGVDLVLVIASIVVAMSAHEAMHGYVSHWLGDTTAQEMGRLTLNPLKHIDLVTTILLPLVLILSHIPPIFAAKPVPFDPHRLKYGEYGMALVGLAGPATNLVLALIAAGVFRLTGASLSGTGLDAVTIFIAVNIGFFVFNLIPFPPLDGSRLLYAFAPEPLQDLMRQIEGAGFLVILAFIFIIFQFISGPIVNIENSLINLLLGQ